jgi:hypothetical protein
MAGGDAGPVALQKSVCSPDPASHNSFLAAAVRFGYPSLVVTATGIREPTARTVGANLVAVVRRAGLPEVKRAVSGRVRVTGCSSPSVNGGLARWRPRFHVSGPEEDW